MGSVVLPVFIATVTLIVFEPVKLPNTDWQLLSMVFHITYHLKLLQTQQESLNKEGGAVLGGEARIQAARQDPLPWLRCQPWGKRRWQQKCRPPNATGPLSRPHPPREALQPALHLDSVLAMEEELGRCQQHLQQLVHTLAKEVFKVGSLKVVLARGVGESRGRRWGQMRRSRA